ncbi:hypothetical protein [Photobacterium leiognathi]|uniref:hypothetical protein n=1 Tax=Photobacterium leiognathi TaxID=553611 RepID=UPI0029821B12|nr:hypothetical protein [Photobacterium leiognathi]
MATKQTPIQINRLDSSLHELIVNGDCDQLNLSPEVIMHLAKLTNNAAWLGWAMPTTSRSTRSALLLEFAFNAIKNIDIGGGQSDNLAMIGQVNNSNTDLEQAPVETSKSQPQPIEVEPARTPELQKIDAPTELNDTTVTPQSQLTPERIAHIKKAFG